MIYGTKEQLQRIGIGVGKLFPGEAGGPKRLLNVTDPRGFPCSITRSDNDIYAASISFPGRGRDYDEPKWMDYAPGVLVSKDLWWGDRYVGTAEALVTAGLVRKGRFPGDPGMNKTRVSISANGKPISGRGNKPGDIFIQRSVKTRFEVFVHVDEGESDRRSELHRRAGHEWEQRMRLLPRPAPLMVMRKKNHDKAESGLTNYEWLAGNIRFSSSLIDVLKDSLTDGDYRYTDASSSRILSAIADLRSAIQEGVAVRRVEEFKREGNVIHFPGRAA